MVRTIVNETTTETGTSRLISEDHSKRDYDDDADDHE